MAKIFFETRNYAGIQFEDLRRVIDPKFNATHDELSDCFYNGKPFRDYGILNKEQFDKLHGLIFKIRNKVFHEENMKLPKKDQVPEEKYNIVRDGDGNIAELKSESAVAYIEQMRAEGYKLVIE